MGGEGGGGGGGSGRGRGGGRRWRDLQAHRVTHDRASLLLHTPPQVLSDSADPARQTAPPAPLSLPRSPLLAPLHLSSLTLMSRPALGLPCPESGRRGEGSGVVPGKDGVEELRAGRAEEGGVPAGEGGGGDVRAEVSGRAGLAEGGRGDGRRRRRPEPD